MCTLVFSSHLPSQGLSPDLNLRNNSVMAKTLISSLLAHMCLTSAKWPCTPALFMLFEGKLVYMQSGKQLKSPKVSLLHCDAVAHCTAAHSLP